MDSTRLAQIRKEFYLATRSRVEAIIGRESTQLRSYREKYEKELSRLKPTASSKKIFSLRLKQADIILVGDFHVLKQSSRGLLRLIRKIKPDFVLCLECLKDTDQKHIDQFLDGKLAEKDFLSKVQWKKSWSFPWENYRPLLKWAQANQVKIYGINSDRKGLSLSERDVLSAQVIENIRQRHTGKQIFVQYGDLHLASAHLPKQIKKFLPKDDLCVIYQSPEIIYFNIMEKQKEISTDVVRLSSDQWALNVLPPWVKWQDYLLYLESGFDKKVKRSETDLTDNVAHTVQLLSESFGFKNDLSALSVYSSDDDLFFEHIENLPAALKKRILENIQEGHSFYIPELQIAYLSRLSVNHVARVAAQYIYFLQKGFTRSIVDPKKDFLKLIWLEMVTYLCSKFANPKRKSDTLQDIRQALQKEQFDDRGKEALMLALNQKLVELQFVSLGQVKNFNTLRTQSYSKRSYTMASQILGGIMGEKFYYALTKKQLRLPKDNRMIFKDLTMAHFAESYYESLDFIESLPTAFKSKFDKL
ncbi:MAG: ChaN family lipoprotein [Bdellovibrio sp.]|nr:ChaN family lipoprotein [Bdellovibrio sp.]